MAGLVILDLASDDLASSVELSRKACQHCGFFYVKNHGISPEFMKEVFDQSKRFFDLPLSEKSKYLRNENVRGYTPYLDQKLDPSKQTKGDCKEGYCIGPEAPKEDPRSSLTFYGSNVWPSDDVLPGWRTTMEKYQSLALNVGRKVSKLIALALNLEADFFEKPGRMDYPMATLRLLHYSGEKSDPEKGIFGCGAHSDWGLLTLLACDGTPGLQICRDKEANPQIWEDVEPIEGAFVVNLGDMLERWTNNLFRSTLHRVLTSGKERYSIPFFLAPNCECIVECLNTCVSEENPARFSPVSGGEYLRIRFKESLLENPEALLSY